MSSAFAAFVIKLSARARAAMSGLLIIKASLCRQNYLTLDPYLSLEQLRGQGGSLKIRPLSALGTK
jgi:hypothetical protein